MDVQDAFSQIYQTKFPIIFQSDYAPQLRAYKSSVVHVFANIWYYQISKLFTVSWAENITSL